MKTHFLWLLARSIAYSFVHLFAYICNSIVCCYDNNNNNVNKFPMLLNESKRRNCELIENVMDHVIGNERQFLPIFFPYVIV